MTKAISLLGMGVFATLMACGSDQTDRGAAAVKGGTEPLTGAIWTTVEDGSVVNENHYDDCRMVYLNGGPRGGSKKGLPAGDYVFLVTDPAGKEVLSSDAKAERMVRVGSDGRFETYLGATHDTGTDLDADAMTVQLWPFDATPNPGGVYKAWLFRAEDYAEGADLNKLRHKTDNFKCDRPGAPPPPRDDAGPPPPCEGEDCADEL